MEEIKEFKKNIKNQINNPDFDIIKLKRKFQNLILKYVNIVIKEIYVYEKNKEIIEGFSDYVCNFIIYDEIKVNIYLPMRGKILITGPKSVGKTLLMETLYKISSELFPRYLILFINYEIYENKMQDLKKVIFKELEKKWNEGNEIDKDTKKIKLETCNVITIDSIIENYKIPIFLFADEVQDLYVDNTEPNYNVYVKNISTILEIGKSKMCYGIISGSSSRIKDMIFKKNSYENVYKNYPNLNDTVYINNTLLPIRDKKELDNFLIYKYPLFYNERNIDNKKDSIISLYYNTGGVIGIIEMSITGSINSLINTRKDYFKQKGIYYFDLCAICKRRRVNNYHKIMYNLRDNGLIYEKGIEEYEFLYPMTIDILNKYFKDNPTRMELMALEGTLSKWDNQSSAGHSNENLIKRYLDIENVEDLIGELYSLKKEEGNLDDCIKLGNENTLKNNNQKFYIGMQKSFESGLET
ncbi:hypothetical protein BY458DRAFT_570355, partial [Sporodiniella umbellata]